MLYQVELQAQKPYMGFYNCKESVLVQKNKEVIQPQVPLRLPCDDLTHLTELRFDLIKKLNLT